MSEVSLEDLKFPKAIVARIIKDALPEGAKVSKEAQIAIARSASIFILHATSFANENAQSKKRKVVTAEDIFHAIRQLECEELEDSIIEGLEEFKKKKMEQSKKRSDNKAKRKEMEKKQVPGTSANTAVESPEPVEEDEEEDGEEDENDDVMELSDEDEAANGGEEAEEENGEEEKDEDDDDVVEIDEDE